MMVREISQAELEDWVQMRSDLWPGDDHRPAIASYFLGECPEPALVMVCLSDEGVVAGHIELSVRSDAMQHTHGFIEGLYVKPRFRNGSVYRDLIRAALRWSAGSGFASVLADKGPRLYEIPHHGRPRLIEDDLTEEELHRRYPLQARQSPAEK